VVRVSNNDVTRMLPYAERSLDRMVAGDEAGAVAALGEMHRDLRGGNVYILLTAWIDWAIAARLPPGAPVGGVELTFMGADAEEVGAQQVDPAVRWAGQLFSARLAGDDDTLQALCATVTPAQRPGYVMAVLHIAAALLRGAGAITEADG
jgi:hypothetical protein